MNIRRMSRSEWTLITKKKQIIRDYSQDGKTGKISLLRIDEVSEPFERRNDAVKPLVLADVNYSWVQLAMDHDFAWFTVMFDDRNRFLQIYIDVTEGNHTDCEDPWFRDLYLDYVIDEKNVIKLDAEELEQACRENRITEKQYAEALDQGKLIEEYLSAHHQKLIVFFKDLLKELQTCMNQTD